MSILTTTQWTFWYCCNITLDMAVTLLTFCIHTHKKWKDSLETRTLLLLFLLELEISGVAVQSIHQNNEKWWLLWGITKWKWLWDCFTHFPLLWPWCHGFWGSLEDRYRSKGVLQMLFVCYYLLNSQNIPINNKLWKKVGS